MSRDSRLHGDCDSDDSSEDGDDEEEDYTNDNGHYQSVRANTDLTSSLIHRVTCALPGAFEGRWLVCVCHTCRQKICGVSSEPLKSYSGRDPCWPSAAGGRVLSLFNTCAFLGSSSGVTVLRNRRNRRCNGWRWLGNGRGGRTRGRRVDFHILCPNDVPG